MYDPGRRGKKRDLRRGLSGNGLNPHRFWKRYHRDNGQSEHFVLTNNRGVGYPAGCDCPSWHVCCNLEREFIQKWLGGWARGYFHAPAHYRRRLNRQYRARCTAELRRAFRDWNWDNYLPPTRAEDVDWSWF